MRFFDSHAHYWDARFAPDRDELLRRLFSESVDAIINVGTSPATSRMAVEQARQYPHMYTALGIHPTDCADLADQPEKPLCEIQALLSDPASRAVAVGEIGLDYHWEPFDKEKQQRYFCAQMELARALKLPVVVHDRDAHGDCFEIVCRYPDVTGVFHSYSGSAEMALDLIRRGWYISFSGTISFTNARRVREVASVLPHDRVLIETDAPYLTPHPHRGERNHSGYLPYTCAALAEAWGCSQLETAQITARNAAALFGVPLAAQTDD
jgi:TatD DNase family protein